MLVVIPSYQRISSLKWVLSSLMQAKLPECPERFLICIANNAPSTQSQLHQLLDEFRSHYPESPWQWHVLDRDKTLYPIDNWYSAIQDVAEEGEVVFLHGDDDLFLPWACIDRYQAITATNADMLMTESVHRIFFLQNDSSVSYSGTLPQKKKGISPEFIEWAYIAGWGPAFIGNHCYRYTDTFRQALALSFTWCHQQDWLDWNTRTLMLPYYLPFAVKFLAGELYGLRQTCVIRGGGIEEILNAPFGVSGWNSGFLVLCAYGVLGNHDLEQYVELNHARIGLADMASKWYATFFFDRRIPSQMRKETLRKIHLPDFSICSMAFLKGIKMIIIERLRQTGFPVGIRSMAKIKRNEQSAVTFLERLHDLD